MFIDFKYEKKSVAVNLDKVIHIECDYKDKRITMFTELEPYSFYFEDEIKLKLAYDRMFNGRFYDSPRISISAELGLIEQKRSVKK